MCIEEKLWPQVDTVTNGILRSVVKKRLCRIKKSSDNILIFFAILPDYAVDPKIL